LLIIFIDYDEKEEEEEELLASDEELRSVQLTVNLSRTEHYLFSLTLNLLAPTTVGANINP
jgi:hypothetical protein